MSIEKITIDNLFSERLTLLLKNTGVKKNKVAAEIGISAAAVTKLSKGQSNPSIQTIKSLSRFFKVQEEWLEYGTGEREKRFEVIQLIEPETKKAADHPLKQAIYSYVDKMTEAELLAEVTALAQKFSAEQKQ